MRKLALAAFLLATFILMVASSCDNPNAATTSATCGFLVGDGTNGHDASVHNVYYPNQEITVGDHEKVWYVPCNSRNFIVNPAGERDANGHDVGDRHTASIAYTKSGTKVRVWSRSYWTLNEDQVAMRKFWDVCLKYNCASQNPQSGTANFSIPGWNGMLGENFGPSVDKAAFDKMADFSDAIWQKHSPALYEDLSTKMSTSFSESVRTKTGYNSDLFCGSGNSVWTGRPGHSNFTCRNVRIEVTDVEPFNTDLNQNVEKKTQAQQDLDVNQARLKAAKELYGQWAGFWIGLQDTIAKCKETGSTCVIRPAINITGLSPKG